MLATGLYKRRSTLHAGRRNSQIFQKRRNRLQMLRTKRMAWHKIQTEDPQTLDATAKQNILVRATWR